MAVIMSKMSSRGQLAYAEAGNVVEQTVGAIRTVRFTADLGFFYTLERGYRDSNSESLIFSSQSYAR